MKKIYFFVLILLSGIIRTAAQQSGEITPRGIVYPRYTTANRPTGVITSGTTIFNTTLNAHQYYNGSTWVSITNATGGSPWTLTGGAIHNNSGERVGINSTKPSSNLEVQGGDGLLVSESYTITTATPAAAITMPYVGTLPDINSQAGRILDPGGTGNYLTNTSYQSYVKVIPAGGADAIRFTFETLDLGSGYDTFIQFSTTPSSPDIMMIFPNSDFPTQKSFIVREPVVYIRFYIPEGAPSAPGFQLLYESIKLEPGLKRTHSEFVGSGMMYSTEKKSFATGTSKARGDLSASFGASLATGGYSIASGTSRASGLYSVALGNYARANGHSSTALSGGTANESSSIAIGSGATSNGNGTMVLSAYATSSLATQQLMAGFRSYVFYTVPNHSTYVTLSEGSGSWTGVSDSTKKERHIPVNGENILGKISDLNLTTWNFKNATERHYGPMAQDFYAAFGKDDYGTIGSDTTINTGDFDGINLIAIQALEKRTKILQNSQEEQIASLRNENAQLNATLRSENTQLTEKVNELQQSLLLLYKKHEELLSKMEAEKTVRADP